jgi:hypothetical protein
MVMYEKNLESDSKCGYVLVVMCRVDYWVLYWVPNSGKVQGELEGGSKVRSNRK